jgi:NADH:ubiquinone oxidoreductase subunit E
MKKINVTICTGTACFVMGASEIMLLGEKLPDNLKDKVEISGCTCMGECHGERKAHLPFVRINDEVIEDANIPEIVEHIEKIIAGKEKC